MPSAASPVRIGLVGAGAMGSYHARVISQSPDAELAAIVDPDQPNGSELADRFGTQWMPELDDFHAFDAVVIASPTAHHVEWAHRALDADTPLLVEKPLSESLDEVVEVVGVAERRGVPFTVGLLERFNPALMTIFDIVEAPVHVTTVRHSPYADRITTGVAFDLLIHDVDIVLRMTGQEPTDVSAHFAHVHPKSVSGSEDVAEATLTFGSGMIASLSASRVSQRKIRTLEIAELDRLVEVDLVRQDITVYRHVGADFLSGAQTGYRQQTVIDIPAIEYRKEPLAGQLDHFIDLVRGTADAQAELATIVAPHRVVSRTMER
jgi:predicted dehydrogenase